MQFTSIIIFKKLVFLCARYTTLQFVHTLYSIVYIYIYIQPTARESYLLLFSTVMEWMLLVVASLALPRCCRVFVVVFVVAVLCSIASHQQLLCWLYVVSCVKFIFQYIMRSYLQIAVYKQKGFSCWRFQLNAFNFMCKTVKMCAMLICMWIFLYMNRKMWWTSV